jgi:mannobiose 2-epimerase
MRQFLLAAIVSLTPLSGFMASSETSERSAEIAQLQLAAKEFDAELRQNILPFWLEYSRDREKGGFHGRVDGSGKIYEKEPRGALLSTRILWTFSAAYQRYQEAAYLDMARWAYDDLITRFWDKEEGALYWSVTSDGVPLDTRKIIYVQAFGIYSLAEFHRATGLREPLERALTIYRSIEQHSRDRENLGYFEEFSQDWTKSMARGPRESAMGSLGQKSQNVHLHLLEAYTTLLRVWPDADLSTRLRELVNVLLDRVMDPHTHHLRLFLAEDWSPQSKEFSYGHDIEFAWLVAEAAEVLNDKSLQARVKNVAVKIAEVTLREGVDADGGVYAEGDASGVTNRTKDWWPQAEATVGFLNAYQLSGDGKYLRASLKNWSFIQSSLIDRNGGEWFIGLDRQGRVASPMKIGFWKCCYHNGRACLEMLARIESLTSRSPPAAGSESGASR